MSRRRRIVHATMATIVALVLAGPGAASEAPGVAAMRAELTSTAAELDAFWQAEFAAHGLAYQAPRLIMEAGPLESACAGETWFAAYCPIGLALHVDPADIRDRSGTYGPGLARLTLAHEWTHHIVTILYADGALASALAPILADVQVEESLADCQAGAFVARSWAGDSEESTLVDQARSFLADNASEVHGSATGRIDAFDRGYVGGIVSCGLFPPLPTHQQGAP